MILKLLKSMTKRERLAAFRRELKARGMNCRQLADLWGLHDVTVRLWHCGRVPVPPARLAALMALDRV